MTRYLGLSVTRVNLPIGQMDTLSLILTVAVMTGFHVYFLYIGLVSQCCLLDSSLTFITSSDVAT